MIINDNERLAERRREALGVILGLCSEGMSGAELETLCKIFAKTDAKHKRSESVLRRIGEVIKAAEAIKGLNEDAGGNINIRDKDGRNSLHWVAILISSAFKLLTEFAHDGVDNDAKDNAGKIPYDYAKESGALKDNPEAIVCLRDDL